MPAALTLVHASAVRASMFEVDVVQRFLVFSPSVSSTITLSRSGAGSVAWVNGTLGVRACQPHTRPMVTLVLPAAVIPLTLLWRAVQSLVSRIACVSDPQSAAGYFVWALVVTGVVSCTSYC